MGVDILREKEEEMFLCANSLFDEDTDFLNTLRRLDNGFNLFGRGATQKNEVLETLWRALSERGCPEIGPDAFDDTVSFSALYRFFQESTVMPASSIPRRNPLLYADLLMEVCMQLDAIAAHYEEVEGEHIPESGVRILRAMHNLLLTPVWVSPSAARAPVCLVAEKVLSDPQTDVEKNPITAFVGSLNQRDKADLLAVCDNTPLYKVLFNMDDSKLPSTSLFMRSGYPLYFKRQHIQKHPKLQTQDAFWVDMLSHLAQNPEPASIPVLDTWYRKTKEFYPSLMKNFHMGSFLDALSVLQTYKLGDLPASGRIMVGVGGKLIPRENFAYLVNRYFKDVWNSDDVPDREKERLREFLTTAALFSVITLKENGPKEWGRFVGGTDPLLSFTQECYFDNKALFGSPGSYQNAGLWLGVCLWDGMSDSPVGRAASLRSDPFLSPLNDMFAGACHSEMRPEVLLPSLDVYFDSLSNIASPGARPYASRAIRRKPLVGRVVPETGNESSCEMGMGS